MKFAATFFNEETSINLDVTSEAGVHYIWKYSNNLHKNEIKLQNRFSKKYFAGLSKYAFD